MTESEMSVELGPKEEDLGSWVPGPSGMGRVWSGEISWRRYYNDRKGFISFLFGRPHFVSGVFLVDGQEVEGTWQRSMVSGDDGATLLRRIIDNTWVYYSVTINDENVSLSKTEITPKRSNAGDGNVLVQRFMADKAVKDFCLDDRNARLMYQALCNQTWKSLREDEVDLSIEVSFRAAGRIIANIRPYNEDYIDFYLSPLTQEGDVFPEVSGLMKSLDIIQAP